MGKKEEYRDVVDPMVDEVARKCKQFGIRAVMAFVIEDDDGSEIVACTTMGIDMERMKERIRDSGPFELGALILSGELKMVEMSKIPFDEIARKMRDASSN